MTTPSSIPTVKLLIDGEFIESTTQDWRDVVNPATQEVLARVPFATADEVNAAIDAALGDMGDFVGADRAYLFAYDFQTRTSSNTHEWCAEGIASGQAFLQNLPMGRAQDWEAAHQRGEMVYVPDVQALPESPLKDLIMAQGIRSLMTLPLTGQDGCLGYVGLDSVRSTHEYDEEKITLLKLFAQMLVNLQERSRAQAQLLAMAAGGALVRALAGWLHDTAAARARALGFAPNEALVEVVRAFVAEDLEPTRRERGLG